MKNLVALAPTLVLGAALAVWPSAPPPEAHVRPHVEAQRPAPESLPFPAASIPEPAVEPHVPAGEAPVTEVVVVLSIEQLPTPVPTPVATPIVVVTVVPTPEPTVKADRFAQGDVATASVVARYFPEQAAKALRVTMCESRGNATTNTGNGYWGMWQFDLRTWQSVGGTGLPSNASAEEQTMRARMLYDQRGWQPWPHCGKL